MEAVVAKVIRRGAVAVLVLAAMVGLAVAQESKPVPSPRPQIPLKVQLVISRYQGDKKISNVPYSLWVTTNAGRTSLRMGVQVPIPSTGGYSLKDVGTNIDCVAEPAAEQGVFMLSLVVTDSSLFPSTAKAVEPEGQKSPGWLPPTIRNFTSTFNILLHDGQTAQYTSVTDPVNGEVLKIDATLNVLK
jgi:hypothetical protein